MSFGSVFKKVAKGIGADINLFDHGASQGNMNPQARIQQQTLQAAGFQNQAQQQAYQQQAVHNLGLRYHAGQIPYNRYQAGLNAILSTGNTAENSNTVNPDITNYKKDNNITSIYNGAGNAIVKYASPQSILGSAAEFGGKVLNNQGLENWGHQTVQPVRDLGQMNSAGAANQLAYKGGNIAGTLLASELSPAGKIPGLLTNGLRFGLTGAADTSNAIKEAGGSRNAQLAGGGVSGVVQGGIGALSTGTALGKIPIPGVTSAVGKSVAAGLGGATENVVQTLADNLIAQHTYDPTRSTGSGIKEAAVTGFALPAITHGAHELMSPEGQAKALSAVNTVKNSAKGETAETLQLKQTSKQLQQRYDNANNSTLKKQISKQIASVNAQRNSILEGGYAKNPFANEEPQLPANKHLRQFEYTDTGPLTPGEKATLASLEGNQTNIDYTAAANDLRMLSKESGQADLYQKVMKQVSDQKMSQADATEFIKHGLAEMRDSGTIANIKAGFKGTSTASQTGEIPHLLNESGIFDQNPNSPEATALQRSNVPTPPVSADSEIQSLLNTADSGQLSNDRPSFILGEDKQGNQQRVRINKDKTALESFVKVKTPEAVGLPDAPIINPRVEQPITLSDLKTSGEQFKKSTDTFLGAKEAAKTQNILEVQKLPKVTTEESLKLMDELENGVQSGNFKDAPLRVRDTLDAKYKQLTAAGIDIGYLQDYFPHKWQNEAQVKQEYQILNLKAGIQQPRELPTIAEGIKLGFKPITTDYREAVNNYLNTADRLLANRQYFETLKSNNLIAEAGTRPQGMQIIDAPGLPQPRPFIDPETGNSIQGNYYAKPDVASQLNKLFSPQERNPVSKVTANVSKTAQQLFLSGGVPGTPLNSFGLAQWQKMAMSGHPISATKDFFRSFSEEKTTAYEKKNVDVIQKMQKEGLAYHGTLDAKSLSSVSDRIAESTGATGKAKTAITEAWNKAVEDPTFRRLLPTYELDTFKSAYERAIKKGLPESEASRIAGETVQKAFGTGTMSKEKLGGKFVKTQTGKDLVSTFFFAPRFRESMVNFWGNNVKALGHPKSPEYHDNLVFMASATILFGAMQAANMALNNGKTTFQNDNPYDKLSLNIPTGDTSVAVPFLSSTATVPRLLINSGVALSKGDVKGFGSQAKGLLSQPVRPVVDLLTNQNYAGNPITQTKDTGSVKLTKDAKYLAGQFSHPWIAATLGADTNSPAQTVATATELPIRFRKNNAYNSPSGTKMIKVGSANLPKGQTVKVNGIDTPINTLPLSDKITAQLKNIGTGDIQESDVKSSVDEIGKTVNSWVPAGMPPVKADTILAKDWASFDKRQRAGTANPYSLQTEKNKIISDAYIRTYGKNVSNLFHANNNDVLAAAQSGQVQKLQMDNAITLDNALVSAGLKSTPSFSNTLRTELGYGKAPSTTKARTSSGRKSVKISSGKLKSFKAPKIKSVSIKKTKTKKIKIAKVKLKAIKV